MNKFFDESLEFEINLIGYKSKGECILFFIKADGRVVYSGLVDCYEMSCKNVMIDLLGQAGIDCLDFICWTHPHDDHTAGLDKIIDEFCNERTKIWIPPVLTTDIDDFSRNIRSTYGKLFSILESKKRDNTIVRDASDVKLLERIRYKSNTDNLFYEFSISSFAPESNLLLKKQINEMFDVGNLYSIGLIINIGHFYVVLAGDIENYAMKTLPDMNFSDLKNGFEYLKIPHHSSKSSDAIIDRFNSMEIGAPIVATTTVFRANKLPDLDVLNRYCGWSKDIEVYSTGDISNDLDEKCICGIIKTSIDVLGNREFPIETSLRGNAISVSDYLNN